MELVGKVAIVTGGSRGLGRAIGEAFLREGATVVCASRSCAVSVPVRDERRAKGIAFDQVDVADPKSVGALMARTVEAYGRLDIVVANAGVSHDGMLAELPLDAWRSTIDTNLNGTLHAIQAAVPHMRKCGGGRIITMSSMMATRPARGAGAYGVSKAGIEALTRVAAIELGGDDILVNCLAPGVLDEGLGAELRENEKVFSAYQKRVALRRQGGVSEVAEAALFLAGPRSTFTTGAVLEVNGGLSWG